MQAARIISQLNLNAQQIHAGRHNIKARHNGRGDSISQGHLAKQKLKAGFVTRRAVNAQSGRGIALWIHIDKQDSFINRRQSGRQINRRRGFTDAALLIGQTDKARGCRCIHIFAHKSRRSRTVHQQNPQ